nr:VC1465 family Xer recombination activation factor [Acidovorax sp. SRB_24]
MYRSLGLDLPGCAQLLHVTERTLHNWQSGKHDIPFAAYKLLRLLNRMDLPGPSWAGWCFHGGKLWSPEGRSFVGTDSSWWSLLVRRADCFGSMFKRSGQFEQALMALVAERRDTDAMRSVAPAAGRAAGREPLGDRREAPVPNLLIVHFPTQQTVFGANTGLYAIKPVAKTAYSLADANHCSTRRAA